MPKNPPERNWPRAKKLQAYKGVQKTMQFKLPELGEGVHEGELIKWKVKPGDKVAYDQPLCEIMTDKATVEIPSAFQGTVATVHTREGETVHVGQLMLSFEGTGSAQATSETAKQPSAPKSAP